jgi:hypothetical protein
MFLLLQSIEEHLGKFWQLIVTCLKELRLNECKTLEVFSLGVTTLEALELLDLLESIGNKIAQA